MSDIAIRMRGVGKRYRTGAVEDYRTLRDSIVAAFRRGSRHQPSREVWAVKDVDLDVARGEVLGIIGANGAGKSTLLKLLTRITQPNAGRIEIDGRVGALLEVGTGFHPDLTGLENIHLSGSILGMRNAEIENHLDDIIDFSGIDGDYIDTPVKRYSSGMRVRLGFSIAAHLEPEILVVDEVLAVGDAEFQRRCLDHIKQSAISGKTILFVSHQMEAIQSLCTRAIWMKHGSIVEDGVPAQVVPAYLSFALASSKNALSGRKCDGGTHVTAIDVLAEDGVRTGAPVRFRMTIESERDGIGAEMRLLVTDQFEKPITVLANENTGEALTLRKGVNIWECSVPKLPFTPGVYLLSFALRAFGQLEDKVVRAQSFEVHPGDFVEGVPTEHFGAAHMPHRWSLR